MPQSTQRECMTIKTIITECSFKRKKDHNVEVFIEKNALMSTSRFSFFPICYGSNFFFIVLCQPLLE